MVNTVRRFRQELESDSRKPGDRGRGWEADTEPGEQHCTGGGDECVVGGHLKEEGQAGYCQ